MFEVLENVIDLEKYPLQNEDYNATSAIQTTASFDAVTNFLNL